MKPKKTTWTWTEMAENSYVWQY